MLFSISSYFKTKRLESSGHLIKMALRNIKKKSEIPSKYIQNLVESMSISLKSIVVNKKKYFRLQAVVLIFYGDQIFSFIYSFCSKFWHKFFKNISFINN